MVQDEPRSPLISYDFLESTPPGTEARVSPDIDDRRDRCSPSRDIIPLQCSWPTPEIQARLKNICKPEQLIDFDLAACQFLARQTNPSVLRNVLRDYQQTKKTKIIRCPSAFIVSMTISRNQQTRWVTKANKRFHQLALKHCGGDQHHCFIPRKFSGFSGLGRFAPSKEQQAAVSKLFQTLQYTGTAGIDLANLHSIYFCLVQDPSWTIHQTSAIVYEMKKLNPAGTLRLLST